MTSEEPKVSQTGRYSTNETCTILGIHRATLHRYTMGSKIRCGFRKANRRRFYLGSEIMRFWKAQY